VTSNPLSRPPVVGAELGGDPTHTQPLRPPGAHGAALINHYLGFTRQFIIIKHFPLGLQRDG
jgi:hypothetical protein